MAGRYLASLRQPGPAPVLTVLQPTYPVRHSGKNKGSKGRLLGHDVAILCVLSARSHIQMSISHLGGIVNTKAKAPSFTVSYYLPHSMRGQVCEHAHFIDVKMQTGHSNIGCDSST